MNAGLAILPNQVLQSCLLAVAPARETPENLVLIGSIVLFVGLMILLFALLSGPRSRIFWGWPLSGVELPRWQLIAMGIVGLVLGLIYLVMGIWRWLSP